MDVAKNNTRPPPIGSTIPLNDPRQNDFQRELPAARKGIDTIAPSGIFWIAIPRAISQGAGQIEIRRERTGQRDTDRHSLREIMDCYCQCQFGGAGQAALWTLRFSADMNVRGDVVDNQQKCETCQQTDGRRHYGIRPFSHVDGRNYQ